MILETTTGKITEATEFERNGVPVGRVSGLITTFVPDRPFESRLLPVRFERTAFDQSIKTHRERGNRPIRLKNEHMKLIGGFPIDMVSVNSDGLFGVGEINLQTQEGAETFSLAKQGVLTDLSMGYTVTESHDEDGSKVADSVNIFEASVVEEPANQGARITSLESLTSRDLEKILLQTGHFTRTMARALSVQILECEEAVEAQVEVDLAKAMADWLGEEKNTEVEALQAIISELRGENP
jgi:HK97 family phage prohead protease